MMDTDPIDLAARLNVEGHIRTRSARDLWQVDRAADTNVISHTQVRTEHRGSGPGSLPGVGRSGVPIAVPRDPVDVPASADPSPPFDDLEIPECLKRT